MASVIIKDVLTTSIDSDWTSPDGKVTIWTIKLETPDGDRHLYKTMSKKIAQEGWRGDVELYTNDKGKDYIRQAPKEESPKGSGYDDGQAWGNAKTNATQLVINTMESGTTLNDAVRATIAAARVLYSAKPEDDNDDNN